MFWIETKTSNNFIIFLYCILALPCLGFLFCLVNLKTKRRWKGDIGEPYQTVRQWKKKTLNRPWDMKNVSKFCQKEIWNESQWRPLSLFVIVYFFKQTPLKNTTNIYFFYHESFFLFIHIHKQSIIFEKVRFFRVIFLVKQRHYFLNILSYLSSRNWYEHEKFTL